MMRRVKQTTPEDPDPLAFDIEQRRMAQPPWCPTPGEWGFGKRLASPAEELSSFCCGKWTITS